MAAVPVRPTYAVTTWGKSFALAEANVAAPGTQVTLSVPTTPVRTQLVIVAVCAVIDLVGGAMTTISAARDVRGGRRGGIERVVAGVGPGDCDAGHGHRLAGPTFLSVNGRRCHRR